MPFKKPKVHHDSHHRRTKHFVKVYSPYLPLLLVAGIILGFGFLAKPNFNRRGVLAYATNTNVQGLLDATNTQRSSNSKSNLSLNSQLSSAAQTKANDMVARNYWSHVTPDGKQPWYFIDQAGYVYKKAGENLAYGFSTSSSTVGGWMNSPSHRDNLLDSAFSEVGFGIANSADYQSSGEETIVVAMYGAPQVAGASAAAPTPAPTTKKTTTTTQTKPATTPQAAPTTPAPEVAQPQPVSSSLQFDLNSITDTSAISTLPEPAAKKISRIESLTLGKAPWANLAVGLITGASLAGFIIKHAVGLRKLVLSGERFILHHPLLDTTLISLIALGLILSRTAGVIR